MAVLYAVKNKICVSTEAWSFRMWVKAIEKSFFLITAGSNLHIYHLYIINYGRSQCISLMNPHSSACVTFMNVLHVQIFQTD